MKSNYQPWQININDFYKITDEKEKLKFLLNFAVLAPSGHNSQPWEFSIVNDATVDIFINKERSLKKGDPQGRLLLMSFGCLIENLLIAGDFFRVKPTINYFPSSNPLHVARVVFEYNGKTSNKKDHLIFQITKRHTNRGPYKDQKIPNDFIALVGQKSNEKVKGQIISDKNLKEAIANLVLESNVVIMDKDYFREELSHYIKSNFTKSHTGMPGFTLGLPAPVSIFASWLIKKTNMSRKSEKADEKLLKQGTPAFLIISTQSDKREDWLNTGFFLQNVWLLAQLQGLNCAPFASVIQIPEFREKLQKALNSNYFPQIVLRVGYPKKEAKASPRFNIDKILSG